uniref:Uncharacterized protein n=1 Tax=Arundo donax TaxID=35708 RepID=A0A0A9GE29_ARUDO
MRQHIVHHLLLAGSGAAPEQEISRLVGPSLRLCRESVQIKKESCPET